MAFNEIHYLNWDMEDDNTGPASTLFHEMHVHDHEQDSFTEEEFDEMYRKVAETELDDLEEIFAAWNTGSGKEAQQYLDLHYCEPCEEYLETPGEAKVHARTKHSDDFQNGYTDLPKYIHGERSMSVGDIVYLENQDTYHIAMPIGWRELELEDLDMEDTEDRRV